jgi:2-hydroxychromene-2-carboxylate isomerase
MQIELAFDYSSPWAFLATAAVPERFAGLEVTHTPVYLRGFEAFREGLPYSPAKLAYIVQDLPRVARSLGVRIKQPSVFPINGVHALRGALAAQREGVFGAYHTAMFAAAWQEDRDVSNKDVVRTIAREAGAVPVADAIDEPSIKDALRASTERAIARGAFGVPTFFVGDQLFWGQDRMADAARLARGDAGRGAPRSSEEAWAFARRWAGAWSRLDVEKVLSCFAGDAVFTSPVAKQITGSPRVVGKDALRAYWTTAAKAITTMRFDLVDVSWAPADRVLVVVYERTKDGARTLCTEHMRFGHDGLVVEGRAFYGA